MTLDPGTATEIVGWTLAVLAALQVAAVLAFIAALRRPRATPDRAEWPEATVLLCLRGADPFLTDCVRAMLSQDYPNYRAVIVIDSRDDPAWDVASRVIQQMEGNPELPDGPRSIELQTLREVRTTCSLKCSGLLQAVESLDDSCEVLALLDADTIAHRSWLRELVAPLEDPAVGAVTGNRWYMPPRASVGAVVRYVWNAAAIVQMYLFRIAWGGTLAIRVSAIRDARLTERWCEAFCEDTMLRRQLGRIGMRIEFASSLMMVNRETCSLGSYYRWVKRQLLTARLYHPAWPLTLAHGLSTSLAPLAAIAVAVWAAVEREPRAAAVCIGSLLLYEVAMLLALCPLEAAVRQVVAARGERTDWAGVRTGLFYLLAVPLTQLVYPAALLAAARIGRVEWRGVHYRIRGPWRIELEEYRPYRAQETSGESL